MSQLKSLRFPDDLYRTVESIANSTDLSVTESILMLVRHGLKHLKENPPDAELIESGSINGKMIAKILHSTFDDDDDLLPIEELEQFDFCLNALSEGLVKSPADYYYDFLRSEVLRLNIARWPVGYRPQ